MLHSRCNAGYVKTSAWLSIRKSAINLRNILVKATQVWKENPPGHLHIGFPKKNIPGRLEQKCESYVPPWSNINNMYLLLPENLTAWSDFHWFSTRHSSIRTKSVINEFENWWTHLRHTSPVLGESLSQWQNQQQKQRMSYHTLNHDTTRACSSISTRT